MIDSVRAASGATFDCRKDCASRQCAIKWSDKQLGTLPENIGYLACRHRITVLCAAILSCACQQRACVRGCHVHR